MIKNKTALETSVNNKTFSFLADFDAAVPDIKEALCQIIKFVGNFEDSVKAQQVKATADAAAKAAAAAAATQVDATTQTLEPDTKSASVTSSTPASA